LQGQKKNDILRNIRLVLFIAAVLISIYFILTGSDPVGIFVGDDLPVPTATYSVDVGRDPFY
jgi:hypothetical protein